MRGHATLQRTPSLEARSLDDVRLVGFQRRQEFGNGFRRVLTVSVKPDHKVSPKIQGAREPGLRRGSVTAVLCVLDELEVWQALLKPTNYLRSAICAAIMNHDRIRGAPNNLARDALKDALEGEGCVVRRNSNNESVIGHGECANDSSQSLPIDPCKWAFESDLAR